MKGTMDEEKGRKGGRVEERSVRTTVLGSGRSMTSVGSTRSERQLPEMSRAVSRTAGRQLSQTNQQSRSQDWFGTSCGGSQEDFGSWKREVMMAVSMFKSCWSVRFESFDWFIRIWLVGRSIALHMIIRKPLGPCGD